VIDPPAFEHPDIDRVAAEIEVGETTQSVLVVKTGLNLWAKSEEYDREHVARLATAAMAYATKNGFDKVRIVSIRIV
jgi:chaperonin GroEL (HSP60 family)